MAGRYRPGRHHHRNSFLQHLFATSPWLGVIVVVLIIFAGLIFTMMKNAGRVFQGIPWYLRLAMLASAGFGIFRLLHRKKEATRPDDA